MIKELRPMATRSLAQYPDFAIYSDAATSSNRIAALLFMGGQVGEPLVLMAACSIAPELWADAFHGTALTYELDLLSLFAFIFTIRALLVN